MGSQNEFSRRSVLMAGAAGAVAAVVPTGLARAAAEDVAVAGAAGLASAASGDPPAYVKLSLAGYSFRKHLDTPGKKGEMSLFDLADLCARLGIDAIEPTSYYFYEETDEYIAKLKRHIFSRGLDISGMPMRNNFARPAGAEFDAELVNTRKWIDIAAKLGAPAIRIFAGSPPKDLSREQAFERVVVGIRASCEYAATRGVLLGIENHGYQTETADDVLKIIHGVNHPWLGANLDTGNFHGDAYANIAKLIPHAVISQIKMQIADPDNEKQRIHADYARIFKLFRDARYRGYVALEYEGDNAPKEVPEEIAKLKAALREVGIGPAAYA